MNIVVQRLNYDELRKSNYEMTRRVRERLVAMEVRFKNALGNDGYVEEYNRHLEFITSEFAETSMSSLEALYFNELINEISSLNDYNLNRGNVLTTTKVMQAVMFHLQKRERTVEVDLFGKGGLFFKQRKVQNNGLSQPGLNNVDFESLQEACVG